jgi:hypothetical protein
MAASVSQPRRLYWVSLPAGHMPKVVIIWLTVSHQGAQRDRAHAAFPHPGFVRPTCSPLSRSVGFVWPSVVLFMSKHCFHYGFARSLRSRKLASFAENGKNGCAIQPRRPLERFPIRLTRKLQGSWPESALDSMLVAFPIGKPVSTFPGNALGACPSNSGFCWPRKRESDSLPPHEQDIPRLEDR